MVDLQRQAHRGQTSSRPGGQSQRHLLQGERRRLINSHSYARTKGSVTHLLQQAALEVLDQTLARDVELRARKLKRTNSMLKRIRGIKKVLAYSRLIFHGFLAVILW